MDMKVYKKTRYQNIYKHIKNGNYVISMSKPVKTSISRIDNKKIFNIDEALKIRDNVQIRQQKATETLHKEDFDTLWKKYMYNCKYVQKLAYNTLNRKEKTYNKYLKNKIDKRVAKTTKEFWASFIDEQDCSDKQKNQIIKELKTFFNWCVIEHIVVNNPISTLLKYKVEKSEMKFWTPEQLKQFLDTVDDDLNSSNRSIQLKANTVKILTIIGFTVGDRIGETRALSFNCFHDDKLTLDILHSINYDPDSQDFISHTKTYESQRVIDISEKVILSVKEYKQFLEEFLDKEIPDSNLLFFNYKNNKPYSDTVLRKHFYYYCEKANVPKIRMYDLRHTYAATMMAEGKEAYMFSKRMGHKKINTTIDVYGHLSNQARKEIAQSTDKYF